jgi:FlaA1/EpsC-like NDP-sugar epimerase
MKHKIFYKNFFIVLGVDLLLFAGSFYMAYLVRFEFNIPTPFLSRFMRILPLVLLTKLVTFYFFDVYRGMWRFSSIGDLLNIIKASSTSTLVIVSFVLFQTRFEGYSRSAFVIDWCFTILFISGFRLGVRFYFETSNGHQSILTVLRSFYGPNRKIPGIKNLLILGGGHGGEKIYREIRGNARLTYNVIGYLDDDLAKVGKKIHGIPVLGPIKDLKAIASKVHADESLIAIPSATSIQMREIVAHCKKSGIPFKTVPAYGELINGRISINAIREVAYRDLIGRETVKLDEKQIGAYLKGQCIMITGAGGSIGSELCRQIRNFEPEKIVLLERAESPLHEIEFELKQNTEQITIVPILADIQSVNQLTKAFEAHRPQIVFHAAAYKHVPMLELQPWKAIDNNVIGTKNLIEVTAKFNVARFVFVSTDKAVRPSNVMGASKRLTEMLVQEQNGCNVSQTRFMIVRFGNVVGSVGSVVPLFKKQIQQGGPVTVTDPEVKRFFMTIPEASQLILQAGAMGEGGEIFILDMGTPIKIEDMARDLIRLSGFEPDVDIKIEYIGLRPGEKLYEELVIAGENIMPTRHEKIMVLKGRECNMLAINAEIKELIELSKNQDAKKIRAKLHHILPEYNPVEIKSIKNSKAYSKLQ